MNTEPNLGEGYILITAKDFDKYAPKLATDEWHCKTCGFNYWHNSSTDCFDAELFDPSLTYRRKINPAVVVNENLNTLSSLRKELESIKDRLSWRVSPNRKGEHVVMDGCIVSIVNSATKALDLLNRIELAAKTLKEVE